MKKNPTHQFRYLLRASLPLVALCASSACETAEPNADDNTEDLEQEEEHPSVVLPNSRPNIILMVADDMGFDDAFLFCVYTGLSFADLKELTQEHIIKDNYGNEWIRKHRRKSNSVFSVPLLKGAKEILVKYSSNYECRTTGKLLFVPSNQRMNAYLKEIADICGIKKRLTTHTARHSCGSTILLANGVTMENIAKILGHKDIRMTQHYAQVNDKSILVDMAAVEVRMAGFVKSRGSQF